jgi:hypothetical protein
MLAFAFWWMLVFAVAAIPLLVILAVLWAIFD